MTRLATLFALGSLACNPMPPAEEPGSGVPTDRSTPAPEPLKRVKRPAPLPPPPKSPLDDLPEYTLIQVEADGIRLLEKIYYEFNKPTVKQESFPILDEIADALRRLGPIEVRVEVHTDSRGSSEYNRRLSQKRAESTVRLLNDRGVGEATLVPVGIGEDQPIMDGGHDIRERQRRTEFWFTEELPPRTQ